MTQNISASQNTVLFARVVKSKQLALQSVNDSKKLYFMTQFFLLEMFNPKH